MHANNTKNYIIAHNINTKGVKEKTKIVAAREGI